MSVFLDNFIVDKVSYPKQSYLFIISAVGMVVQTVVVLLEEVSI